MPGIQPLIHRSAWKGEFSEVRLKKWPPGIYALLGPATKIRSIVKPGALWIYPLPGAARLFSYLRRRSYAVWTRAFCELRLYGVLGR